MRTETINIYKFNELPDDIKQRARDKWRDMYSTDIHWQAEIFESLKTLFDTANIRMLDYQLGLQRSFIKHDLDSNVAELSGARALAWLENNLFCKLRVTRAQYLKNRKDNFRYGYRIGKIKDCPLTGYCADDDFIDDLLNNVKSGNTLGDSFRWLADKYESILQGEYDYQNSDEYIDEHLEANEYEFDESGDLVF